MSEKFCPNCGKKIRENLKFCVYCGNKLKEETINNTSEQNNNIQAPPKVPNPQNNKNRFFDNISTNQTRIIVLSIVIGVIFIVTIMGIVTNKMYKPTDDEIIKYFENIDYSFANTSNKKIMDKENSKFTRISTKNIEDEYLLELVNLYIQGCKIQENVEEGIDLTNSQEWAEGQEYKAEALIKLANEYYIDISDEELDNCYRIYFWMNYVHINSTNVTLYESDEETYYELEIENNTGTDFEEITFVSSINDNQDYETINYFYDGDSETLKFTLDEAIEEGSSITTSFDVLNYEVYDD